MFTGYCSFDHYEIFNLRCYENDSIGLVKFVDYPCDTVISPSVGIRDVKRSEINYIVYPNPSKELITIEIKEELTLDKEMEIQIFSIEGKLLKEEDIIFENNTTTINIADLKKGVYFVNLITGTKNEFYSGQLIVE